MVTQSIPDLQNALSDPLLLDYPVEVLQKLAKRYRRAGDDIRAGRRQLRFAVNGGYTTSFLAELLPLFLAQRGFAADVRESPYGAFQMEVLDKESEFWTFDPQAVLLAPTHRDLQHRPPLGADHKAVADAVELELSVWRRIWAKIKSPIVQFTFDPAPTRSLAEADGLFPGGQLHYIRAVNNAMTREAPEHVSFIDAEQLLAQLGRSWWDERLFRLAKQPFAMDALPTIANTVAAATAGALGLSRKVLILDLDNTLWGGVIGDDGLDGIRLGPESAEGESYVAFQHYVKSLSKRGIALCVCSKNDSKIAREPFERHGAMVLTADDFADFRANFDDKAANIRAISKTLNLGLDAFVFADDSPVECALVRDTIPEVWTVELSGDPSGFPHLLDRFTPFPVGRLTREDMTRAESYKKLAAVQDEIDTATDIDAFLRDLQPTARIESVRDDTVERMSQLVGKTNQFKLNASTFSPAELRDAASGVIAIRLVDRLQDYGIVAVAVTEADMEAQALIVRNWVMSCRVFSRRLEYLTRELMSEQAAYFGLSRIRLSYIKSGRNGLIEGLLPRLGFSADGDKGWYQADTALPPDMPPHFISTSPA